MILVGTSGFSYDDWVGTWYAPDTPRNRMLEAYAEVFTALELNATYYRTPPRKSAESMVRTAAGRLAFAVKAPGDVTHKRLLDPAIATPFLDFLEPFRSAGVLNSVLLQFPNAFREGDEQWLFLRRCAVAFRGVPLVAELRHDSWDNGRADAELRGLGYSRAILDQPALKGLSASARTGDWPIGYFRFHGRNATAWYSEESPHDRYRYRYAPAELQAWVPVLKASEAKAQSTLAFFNNHPDGNAPRDAEALASMAGAVLRGTGYRDLFG